MRSKITSLIILLILLSMMGAYSQHRYHVTVESDAVADGDILYLSLFEGHYDFRVGIDSVAYKNGASFEGEIEYSQSAMISSKDRQVRITFVLVPDTSIVIKAFDNKLEINGGQENEIRNAYRTLTDSMENTWKELKYKGQEHGKETVVGRFYTDLYLDVFNNYRHKYTDVLFNETDGGFNSIAALEFVYLDKAMRTKEENFEMYNKLSPRMKAHPVGMKMHDYLSAKELTMFPKIELQVDSSGGRFNYDFPAKGYTLVDFWATWCGPCIESFSTVRELYDDYHDSHSFEVIGISLDDSSTSWKNVLKRLNLPWINITQQNRGFSVGGDKDLKGQVNTIAVKTASIFTLPMYFLLDKNGAIVLRTNRIKEVKDKVESLYN